jgi:FKBP-type peptidyl-prolyl cis-trans isomerase 2
LAAELNRFPSFEYIFLTLTLFMTVTSGDQVVVHYTGKLTDGQVFDSSAGKDPLQFEMGAGQLIPGFEAAVVNLKIGDSTTVEIKAEDAYGVRNPQLMLEVGKEQVPPDMKPEVGQSLQVQTQTGEVANVTVAEVRESSIILDANHPLAGKDLVFDIELVAVNP